MIPHLVPTRFCVMLRSFTLLGLTLASPIGLRAESLLVNPELRISEGQKTPEGWQLSPPGTVLAEDKEYVPEGVETSLRAIVGENSDQSGQLMQRINIPPGTEKFILSGYMTSEKDRAAYIEVKLYAGKREVLRINGGVSSQTWQKVSTNIDTHVTDKDGAPAIADRLEVLCRWYQEEKHVGGQVWFAGLDMKAINTTVSILGGSTATDASGDEPKCGWGSRFSEFVRPDVAVEFQTVSWLSLGDTERREACSRALATKPACLLLQFDWSELSAIPEQERSTRISNVLKECIQSAKTAGVPLVLVTPPTRRMFDPNGRLMSEFSGEADLISSIGRDTTVPVVDLYRLSGERLGVLGAEGSLPLFTSIKDRTHFSQDGARLIAAIVAQSLAEQESGGPSLMDAAAARKAL